MDGLFKKRAKPLAALQTDAGRGAQECLRAAAFGQGECAGSSLGLLSYKRHLGQVALVWQGS